MSDIIYGRNTIIEAFEASLDIEKVYLLSSLRGEYEIEVRNYCKENDIPLAKVPEIKLNELTRFKTHQGVAAVISPIKYVDYREVIAELLTSGIIPMIIVLDGVTDVRNIGAIARSAYYFGADLMIVTGSFSGRINEDTVKASAGAILNLPVSRTSSLLTLISELQSLGIMVVATSLKDAVTPYEIDMTIPTAIVLGSEDKGLHYKTLEIVDATVKIISVSEFDSLNVSVAAGILLYECSNQRKAK